MRNIAQSRALLIGVMALLVTAAFTMYSSLNLLNFEFRKQDPNLGLLNKDHPPSSSSSSSSSSTTTTTTTTTSHSDINSNNNDDDTITPPKLILDPSVRYLTFLPFAGLTNQFIGLQNAAFIAMRLNRTLLVPPIISNSHDHDNTHQSWSTFFDFPRFTNLTGVPLLEWDTVRPLTPQQSAIGRSRADAPNDLDNAQWDQLATNITCEIIYGYGRPDKPINHSAQLFVSHFLLRMIYQQPPPPEPGATIYDHHQHAKDELDPDAVVVLEDLIERYSTPSSREIQLVTLSHTFKLKDPPPFGVPGRYWSQIGQFFHFEPLLAHYARERVMAEIRDDHGSQIQHDIIDPESPDREKVDRIPYIAIHLRRGDIYTKCETHERLKCEVPISEYAAAVSQIRQERQNKNGQDSWMPVVVTTDSTSITDFEELESLGWHRIVHREGDEAHEVLGAFGPAFMDASIIAHADVFLGSARSTMSRVAQWRQESWYNRKTIYPKPPAEGVAAAAAAAAGVAVGAGAGAGAVGAVIEAEAEAEATVMTLTTTKTRRSMGKRRL
ncbi:hypothetical protein BG004_007758 [Podila humilis]|nr:hypothetical protein BG004_007758 [Podila humilis]